MYWSLGHWQWHFVVSHILAIRCAPETADEFISNLVLSLCDDCNSAIQPMLGGFSNDAAADEQVSDSN